MSSKTQWIRWDSHQNELQTQLLRLLGWGRFCDVTLACENGQSLKAHRAILCAASNYFDSVLSNLNPDKETLIVMKDCNYDDMKLLIEFMYKGEIIVDQVSEPQF